MWPWVCMCVWENCWCVLCENAHVCCVYVLVWACTFVAPSFTCNVTHLSICGIPQSLLQLWLQRDLLGIGDLSRSWLGNKSLPWRTKTESNKERGQASVQMRDEHKQPAVPWEELNTYTGNWALRASLSQGQAKTALPNDAQSAMPLL